MPNNKLNNEMDAPTEIPIEKSSDTTCNQNLNYNQSQTEQNQEVAQDINSNSEQVAADKDITSEKEEVCVTSAKTISSFLKGSKSDVKKLKKEFKWAKKHSPARIDTIIKPVKKAVIPAAGFGTRFLPATKAIPKEMLPIVNTPSIQHIVQECVDSGITEILIILGRGKSSIENHFDKSVELENELRRAKKYEYLKTVQKISKMANITYVRQKEMRGSGWAVHYAKEFAGDDPVVVLFGDDVMYTAQDQKPVSAQLIEAYNKTGKSILGVQKIMSEDIRKYGVVIPGKQEGRYSEVLGIMEKPDKSMELPSRLTSLGRFVLTSDIYKILEHTPKGKGNEIFLTDAMTIQAQQGGVVAYEFEGRRYDIGDRLGFLEAQVEFGLRDTELRESFIKYLKSMDLDNFN
ncbi:MAG TPA: UTP--glucose-1-phosphate uridylyltransferase [Clostridia bacterium]|nr:UTP--glucose-1-phosphate uridylyltransferase [Clostridia bacterium]